MIAYLNGVNVLNGKKRRGKKLAEKIKKTAKTLNQKRRDLDKKIIAKHKELAKKVGAGVKRIAKIKKDIAVKSTLIAIEKNLMGMATRLKFAYSKDPKAVKNLLSSMGDWEKFKQAINKGDKKQPAIVGYNLTAKKVTKGPFKAYTGKYKDTFKKYKAYLGEDEAGATTGGEAEQYAEATKQGVNLIQKIIEFFKKRKEAKAGDQETIEAMQNSVDADPNIEKTDENGKTLPVSEEAKDINKIDEEQAKDEAGGGLMNNKPLLIGGIAVLGLGAYFLLKKK